MLYYSHSEMKMSDFSFQSRRSPVYSTRGMVAASQSLAVAAGLEILSKGGNAADASVAVAAALNVTEPTSTGLGGDAFALYFEAKTRQVSALNGSGRAPRSLSLERLDKEGFKESLPPYHPYNVTVPGACAMWCDLSERLGRLPLATTLAPAIRLAKDGFPVAPITAWHWQRAAQGQLKAALNGGELTIDGRGPNVGEIFRNPGLARTLKLIAEDGKKAFYEGPIAEAIVSILKEAGGCMQLEDLASHAGEWVAPISVVYRGVRVWECPPNGQGLAALLALNLLEKYDLCILPPLSPMRLHLEIEALRIAFADARWFVSDPAFSPIPLKDLLSSAYADERRRGISPKYALQEHIHGFPATGHDTVYFCVVDGEGNACSFINSNYMGFGTGIVPRGWGFSLQNRGANFSLDPSHPNHLEPGKRPYHTIIPGMVTRESDQSLFGPFGVMGGFMQPQGHVQVLTRMLDNGLDPQAALDMPRFCIDVEKDNASVSLEEGIPEETCQALSSMRHPVQMVGGMNRALFGRGQIITRDPVTGVLCGGSDPRADGCAMGL
jgi:gamma-glutamyltranspeptidase / glutathione hydrolase